MDGQLINICFHRAELTYFFREFVTNVRTS
jgi:hypothetical protein